MRRIVFHQADTGEIVSVVDYLDGTEDAEIVADLPEDCAWLEGDADPGTDYVPDGVITERPEIEAEEVYHVDADGVQRTLFAMPNPVTVIYRGAEYNAGDFLVAVDDDDDGYALVVDDDYLVISFGATDFVFSSIRTGEFEFLVEPPWPYRSTIVTVIADAV